MIGFQWLRKWRIVRRQYVADLVVDVLRAQGDAHRFLEGKREAENKLAASQAAEAELRRQIDGFPSVIDAAIAAALKQQKEREQGIVRELAGARAIQEQLTGEFAKAAAQLRNAQEQLVAVLRENRRMADHLAFLKKARLTPDGKPAKAGTPAATRQATSPEPRAKEVAQ